MACFWEGVHVDGAAIQVKDCTAKDKRWIIVWHPAGGAAKKQKCQLAIAGLSEAEVLGAIAHVVDLAKLCAKDSLTAAELHDRKEDWRGTAEHVPVGPKAGAQSAEHMPVETRPKKARKVKAKPAAHMPAEQQEADGGGGSQAEHKPAEPTPVEQPPVSRPQDRMPPGRAQGRMRSLQVLVQRLPLDILEHY